MSFICNFENRHTDNYKFSVYTKDDPDLLHLKMLVAAHNKRIRDYAKRFNKMPKRDGHYLRRQTRLICDAVASGFQMHFFCKELASPSTCLLIIHWYSGICRAS